ncbi:hypothetical protein LCGC14_2858290 [marine sediment metagenome]|uniref:Uncharacterized protein n=1 Tax=marine sediment metagenome TaxID=412755 RepID=A0A0F8YT80_9ZZZZ
MTIDGPTLIGIGTILSALVALGAWLKTRKTQEIEAGSALVEDALKLQKAAHQAYAEAVEELEEMRNAIAEIRTEMYVLRAEMEFWRGVAHAARSDYRATTGTDPVWWKPFVSKIA